MIHMVLESRQRGAVLIVAMVILLVMTLIGAANMQSSGMQQKMTSNAQSRQQAFQVAESTLTYVEKILVEQFRPLGSYDIYLKDCASGSTSCYEETCAGGFCFFGSFSGADEPGNALPPATAILAPHLDRTIWQEGSGRHNTAPDVIGGANADVFLAPKYVVEFMGFVPRSPDDECNNGSPNTCAPRFRITALAERQGVRARVMLQSTIRVLAGG